MSTGATAFNAEPSEPMLLPTGSDGPQPQRLFAEESSAASLKAAAAERLAAHRSRRAAAKAAEAESEARAARRADAARRESRRGASLVRDAVTARYQQTQSYREFLAAEAERALQQAEAEAEVARRNALAVAEAKQQLLDELEQWNAPGPVEVERREEARGELAHALADIALGAQEIITEAPALAIVEAPTLAVRLAEPLTPRVPEVRVVSREAEASSEELAELEEELEFRHTPEFAPVVMESEAIPANIIQFPRQLVASRKARPRLAEGPLIEEAPREPQLRIFEVEAEQIATTPVSAETPSAPGWQSLMLEPANAPAHVAPQHAQASLTFQPETAPNHRRLMSAAVDCACVLASFVAFATVVAYVSGPALRALPLPVLGGAAAGTLAVFAIAYQLLFFTLSDATPGMHYARISLCTFGDTNPSRKAMRRRVLSALLALCPLGLGYAWIWMDDDRLGWHDRISRMYQRAY